MGIKHVPKIWKEFDRGANDLCVPFSADAGFQYSNAFYIGKSIVMIFHDCPLSFLRVVRPQMHPTLKATFDNSMGHLSI